MRRLRAIRRGGVPPSSLDLIESPTGGGTPPVLRKKTPAFWRVFALLASEKPEGWLGDGFLRGEGGASRANRFKLYSFAFPERGEAGCLYRKTRSGRRGGGCLYRFSRSNVWEPSFYIEKRVGDALDAFFYKVGGVPAFWMRLFMESSAIQRLGNVFL